MRRRHHSYRILLVVVDDRMLNNFFIHFSCTATICNFIPIFRRRRWDMQYIITGCLIVLWRPIVRSGIFTVQQLCKESFGKVHFGNFSTWANGIIVELVPLLLCSEGSSARYNTQQQKERSMGGGGGGVWQRCYYYYGGCCFMIEDDWLVSSLSYYRTGS